MLDSILGQAAGEVLLTEILTCTLASLALGAVIAAIYRFRNPCNRSFLVTLALLPVLVQSVILVVNGNLGAGVAVMGAFSLVRFRSVPGSAREIAAIFFAMAAGLATGMGYLTYALLFTAVVSAALLLYSLFLGPGAKAEKSLRITLPEDIDYTHLFDDLFSEYASRFRLDRVKTTNLGSLFELEYSIVVKDPSKEKRLLDEIRKRNGNLNIVLSQKILEREDTL
ncbi:DUF4956 domain-containing protein [Ruminococcaceae bacterium OttesenSCG-928-I18]|nr:DUF4956 domain-containing protein [Ruminococcaceae bacterium OttesenSCG-928-I18]